MVMIIIKRKMNELWEKESRKDDGNDSDDDVVVILKSSDLSIE
jgi:hypothetical protein